MEKEEIAQFYDEFSEKQIKTGANERLISLYEKMTNLGLKKNSKVLELGCGVGIFTKLLSRTVSSGIIEAVDLSPKSIQIAKKLVVKKNIHFESHDVVKYQPKNSEFDFITLMDVIEHIPLDQHDELFSNLSHICVDKSHILINIPNPDYLNFARHHHPETLQMIDQEVHLFPLLKHFEKHNLEIIFFEKYGIWAEEEYHFMVVRKKRAFKLKNCGEDRNFSKKVIKKIAAKIDTFKYQ
ncbi:class I SAM-dependent methyltransferase [Chryseobacterium sp. SNU WT5]|uniref:class I SAM-dependent methyltransferase n=1 Tax=Chryseobacterium sp. SNU WT5 TaxID=2594269 RepID=UPI00117D1E1A|nr:class I SAM-dependent methyltransferase [Chryseobacterium sp. SNU WT5]QDP85364.1 class I SAM-dependent methyltransferase [Chryseobacterium sp. SNU WT5]